MEPEPAVRGSDGVDPPHLFPPYRSSVLRAPSRPLIPLPGAVDDVSGPMFGTDRVADGDADLTAGHDGEPQGQRIVVHGRLLDDDGRPVRGSLVEVWQANAAGRYLHDADRHPSPLDPNFTGAGRCLTDGDGRYRFVLSAEPPANGDWLDTEGRRFGIFVMRLLHAERPPELPVVRVVPLADLAAGR